MRYVLGLLLALGLCTPVLSAQTALDLSVGLGRGLGGSPVLNRTRMALDATVARSAVRLGGTAIPVAISAYATPLLGGSDCVLLPGAVCGSYPALSSVALLSGWSHHSDFARGPRVLAGPALVWNDGDDSEGLGLMMRADFAESLGSHAAFVFGAQSVIAPKWRGERIATASVTVGVRLR